MFENDLLFNIANYYRLLNYLRLNSFSAGEISRST